MKTTVRSEEARVVVGPERPTVPVGGRASAAARKEPAEAVREEEGRCQSAR
ncbi:MAG: hypothetical protein U9R72_15975 [Chloroflexota bacterium]|nr:hypothetical protein [Chloroflexota bacterium]